MSSLAPQAVRVRTAAGWRDIALQGPPGPGGLLFAEKVAGIYGGYIGPFSPTSENTIWRDAAGTLPLRLTYTPTIDCWWDVTLNLGLVQKTDANYHYAQIYQKLSPADVDGQIYAYDYCMQHASVQTYESYTPSRMWKLAAGTPYTVTASIVVSGGTWQYFAAPEQMWIDGRVFARGIVPTPVIPVVTSLPGSPVDGQECYFVADGTNGVIWHLRYRAASSSAYKWECIGGSPLYNRDDTSRTLNSTAYGDPNLTGPAGPTLVPPLNGDYILTFGSYLGGTSGSTYTFCAPSIAGAAASDADAINVYGVNTDSTPSRVQRINGLAGTRVVQLKFRVAVANSSTVKFCWLSLLPVRVG